MSSKIRQTRAEPDFPQHDWRTGALTQVRTLYALFVQGLFSAAPPGTYRWAPSLADTEIIVTDENPINMTVVGKRPAISFSRGPVQSNTLGMDDMLEYRFDNGKKTKGVLINGVMNINAVSRVDLESENIAWIVAEQLWMHRELLMRAGFFQIGQQFVISPPSPAGSIVSSDSGDEWFATTVSAPFQFSRTSSFTPINKRIVENIGFTLRTGVPQHFQSQGPTTGFLVEETAPGVEAFCTPHPLNPTKMVVVRPAHPNRAGIRPPSMGGRVLPIQRPTVEQSDAPVPTGTRTSFKV